MSSSQPAVANVSMTAGGRHKGPCGSSQKCMICLPWASLSGMAFRLLLSAQVTFVSSSVQLQEFFKEAQATEDGPPLKRNRWRTTEKFASFSPPSLPPSGCLSIISAPVWGAGGASVRGPPLECEEVHPTITQAIFHAHLKYHLCRMYKKVKTPGTHGPAPTALRLSCWHSLITQSHLDFCGRLCYVSSSSSSEQ